MNHDVTLRMIETRLQVLSPAQLVVMNESHKHVGHAGSASGGGHFHVLLVSEMFEGLSRVRRERLVYEVLGDLFPAAIHALSVRALTSGEYNTH